MNLLNSKICGFPAFFLAPLAGYTDYPFRKMCRKFSSITSVTEMISANAIVFKNPKTHDMCRLYDDDRPVGLQLFGGDPVIMRDAAIITAERYNPDFIDINMGCPVNKVVKNGYGSALMTVPKTAAEIIRLVTDAVKIPVSVKIRAGWDHKNKNAVEIAKICQDAGASFITVHGRTRSEMFSGTSDPFIIRDVKQEVSIPVVANGDIDSRESFERIMEISGADGAMIGRGAVGKPWVFAEICNTLSVSPKERFDAAREHFETALDFYKDELLAATLLRKHLYAYFHGIPGAATIRKFINSLESMDDLKKIQNEYFEKYVS